MSVAALAGLVAVSHAQSIAPAVFAGQPLRALGRTGPPAAGIVEGGRLLRMTTPSYPLAARQAGVSGVVTVEALIGVDGRVVRTSVIRGPYPLLRVAQDTVMSWRFEPTLLNGKPVERVAEVDMRFVLGRY
jgi:protein TonB